MIVYVVSLMRTYDERVTPEISGVVGVRSSHAAADDLGEEWLKRVAESEARSAVINGQPSGLIWSYEVEDFSMEVATT